MAKKRTLRISALNLRVVPHPPNAYQDLLKSAYNLQKAVNVRGHSYMIMESIDTRRIQSDGIITGEIAKYTEIDEQSDWFNTESLKPAGDNELNRINIPEHLRPNYSSISFAFDINNHIMTFQSYGYNGQCSPNIFKKYIDRLFYDKRINDLYGQVYSTIIPQKEALNNIFSIYYLKNISIYIQRPNPDDFGDSENEVLQRLERLNAASMDYSFEAVSGQSLNPDDETREFSEIGAKNGYVSGSGKNEDGASVEFSTKEHPVSEPVKYDPDSSTEIGIFKEKSKNIIYKIVNKLI